MDQHARVRAELVFGDRDRFGILVHEQQPASGAQALQHATRMSAPPERAIQIRSVLHHMQPFHDLRSEEHTSEVQSLMRISYAVFCLKKKKQTTSSTYKALRNLSKRNNNHRKDNSDYN